ncbi:hypothetical protein [Nocardioides speluncae]|uniref:hypothetical protein n=1 Tax=Nocardioides speluncae TaxID=2670337 RepID=UPI000D696AB0|nr:hypothetical protein [Nocardioides speluncae]
MTTQVVAGRRRTSLALPITLGLVTGLVAIVGNALAMVVANWTGWLWWLVGAVVALVVSVVQAIVGSHVEARWTGPAAQPPGQAPPAWQPPRQGKQRARGTPVSIALLILLVLGLVGVLLTFGARYVIGYATGDEPGVDRLVAPATVNAEGLEVTVRTFEETRHFTRLSVRVTNHTTLTQRISEYENLTLVGGDGTALELSMLRSDWTEDTNPGVSVSGTLLFKGHLPDGVRRAQLQIATVFALGLEGPDRLTVAGIELRRRT